MTLGKYLNLKYRICQTGEGLSKEAVKYRLKAEGLKAPVFGGRGKEAVTSMKHAKMIAEAEQLRERRGGGGGS